MKRAHHLLIFATLLIMAVVGYLMDSPTCGFICIMLAGLFEIFVWFGVFDPTSEK